MWRGFSETGGSRLNRNTDDTDEMDFHGSFLSYFCFAEIICVHPYAEMLKRIVVVQEPIGIGCDATEAK